MKNKSQNLRILIVDDDAASQEVTETLLNRFGSISDLVSDGFSAVEMLKKNSYDLIFMDIQMPKIDGIETAKRIRLMKMEIRDSNHRTTLFFYPMSQIPIVGMSGFSSDTERENCIRAGMNDYIPKPIEFENLIRTIGRHVRLKHDGIGIPTDTAQEQTPNEGYDIHGMLKHVGGDVEVLKKVLKILMEDIPTKIDQLKEFILETDASNISKLIHALRGNIGILGIKALDRLAAQISEAAKTDNFQEAQRCLGLFENEYLRFEIFIKQKNKLQTHHEADVPFMFDIPEPAIEKFRQEVYEDEELQKELSNIFFDDSIPIMDNIKQAVKKRDFEELTREAHDFRGTCNMFGVRELDEILYSLENAGKDNNLNAAYSQIHKLEKELRRLKKTRDRVKLL